MISQEGTPQQRVLHTSQFLTSPSPEKILLFTYSSFFLKSNPKCTVLHHYEIHSSWLLVPDSLASNDNKITEISSHLPSRSFQVDLAISSSTSQALCGSTLPKVTIPKCQSNLDCRRTDRTSSSDNISHNPSDAITMYLRDESIFKTNMSGSAVTPKV